MRRRVAILAAVLCGLAVARSWAEAEPPAGATVALVFDTSGSIGPEELARTRELAVGVLASLPAGSQVAVFSFDDQSRLLVPGTADADEVRRAVDGLRVSGRYTALHDALYDASRYLRDSSAGRRAILLVTDGKDENSALSLEDGLRVAQETGFPVFCVGVGRVQERVLRRIAKLTGGEYVVSGEATGETLASQILAAAAARAAPPSPSPPPSPPPSTPAPVPQKPAPAAPVRLLLGAGIGLALLVAAGLALLAMRRREPRLDRVAAPGPETTNPAQPRPAESSGFSSTVLTRIDGEEDLERTVVIQESPVLAVTRGPETGMVFELSRQSATSIGRAKANDVRLDDVAISSQHCRIRPEGGTFVLHDLESTNGTLVNNHRVSRHVLAPGDVIKMGDTSLEFRLEREKG